MLATASFIIHSQAERGFGATCSKWRLHSTRLLGSGDTSGSLAVALSPPVCANGIIPPGLQSSTDLDPECAPYGAVRRSERLPSDKKWRDAVEFPIVYNPEEEHRRRIGRLKEWDIFLSYAYPDKDRYVLPLARSLSARNVKVWIDVNEIGWGDNIWVNINRGLEESKVVVLCLSEAFLKRPWPENEMAAAVAARHRDGTKQVLPLILNSKSAVLKTYPMIGALAYREWSNGLEQIADELAELAVCFKQEKDVIHLRVESVHTGVITDIEVPRRASVGYAANAAVTQLGLSTSVDVGSFRPMPVGWVLVESAVLPLWREYSGHSGAGSEVYGFFSRHDNTRAFYWLDSITLDAQIEKKGVVFSYHIDDRLDELGVKDGTTIVLCARPERVYYSASR